MCSLLRVACLVALIFLLANVSAAPPKSGESPPQGNLLQGWLPSAPREELRPQFAYDPRGGPKQEGAFVITADQRGGLHGFLKKTFSITGGRHYRLSAVRKVENVAVPRRSAVVRILWRDDRTSRFPRIAPLLPAT